MQKKQIKTVGQLRDFLVTMMVGLKDGTIEPDVANKAVKIASAINENFYAEIKVQKTRHELANEQMVGLGEMAIGEVTKEESND